MRRCAALLRSACLNLVLMLAAVIAGGNGFVAAESWRAGVARVEITPQQPIQMAGYGARNLPAEGKLTELWAKSLVLEDANGNRGVLITLDLVGIHRDTATKICDRLEQAYGLDRHQIAINCSHTHTGPAVGQNLGPLHYWLLPQSQRAELDEYESSLANKIVAVVGEAMADREPCVITHGGGLCTFAVNRRNNPAAEVPERRARGELVGPYDHAVPVLAVRDESLQLKSLLFGYACHATVLNTRKWSGDYPGYAQLALEARYTGATALFWAGCGADQNPLPRRDDELAKQYGDRLAAAVAEVVEGTMRPVESRLTTRYAEIELPLEDVPSISELRATVESAESKYEQARAKYLLARLGDRQRLATVYPYPVATWLLGDQVRWVFLSGEVVVDYALFCKQPSGDAASAAGEVWVAGYSNDVMAYIPSRRVLAEGGYEAGGSNVYYGMPGHWSPDLQRLILAEVKRQSHR